MIALVTAAGSPVAEEAARIPGLRLLALTGDEKEPLPDLGSGTHAVMGTSAGTFYLHDLLIRARAGRLAGVTLLTDAGAPDARAIGFRHRPWLRRIAALPGTSRPAGPLPAPWIPVPDLAGALALDPAAPLRFDALPCPFPPRIQIQTTTACERACPWCPHPGPGADVHEMDSSLFESLVEQCGAGGVESLELYLHGEPLEDPDLHRRVERARIHNPDATLAISTHEATVVGPGFEGIAGGGPDVVFVSVDPTRPRSLVDRLDRLEARARLLQKVDTVLVVTTLVNLLAPGTRGRFRRLCRERGLPLQRYGATDRAGSVDLTPFAPDVPVPPISPACARPFAKAYVRWDGAVVACCEDWRYRVVLGDLREASLAEIWTGARYRRWREALLGGEEPVPCRRCALNGGDGRSPSGARGSAGQPLG